MPHPVLGEVIVLCAVRAAGASLEEEAIRELLRGRLAAYKVPKRICFFDAEELSFTGNQKLQVGPLRELALARLRSEKANIDGVLYDT